MALSDNIDNVAFATSYDNDKILETYSGSFSVAAGSLVTSTVSQPYGEHVLPVMIFSDDNATWQDAGSATYAVASTTTELSATCSTDATNLVISANNNAASAKTCYYKVALIAEDY